MQCTGHLNGKHGVATSISVNESLGKIEGTLNEMHMCVKCNKTLPAGNVFVVCSGASFETGDDCEFLPPRCTLCAACVDEGAHISFKKDHNGNEKCACCANTYERMRTSFATRGKYLPSNSDSLQCGFVLDVLEKLPNQSSIAALNQDMLELRGNIVANEQQHSHVEAELRHAKKLCRETNKQESIHFDDEVDVPKKDQKKYQEFMRDGTHTREDWILHVWQRNRVAKQKVGEKRKKQARESSLSTDPMQKRKNGEEGTIARLRNEISALTQQKQNIEGLNRSLAERMAGQSKVIGNLSKLCSFLGAGERDISLMKVAESDMSIERVLDKYRDSRCAEPLCKEGSTDVYQIGAPKYTIGTCLPKVYLLNETSKRQIIDNGANGTEQDMDTTDSNLLYRPDSREHYQSKLPIARLSEDAKADTEAKEKADAEAAEAEAEAKARAEAEAAEAEAEAKAEARTQAEAFGEALFEDWSRSWSKSCPFGTDKMHVLIDKAHEF